LPLDDGATVGQLLDLLCDSPGRRSEVFDGGRLKPHIVIIKNGLGISPSGGLKTKLSEGDIISIFPLMGGG
jgi:molybdopterin converting factor small subunit